MNALPSDGKFFERWFALLAKQKLVPALLPLTIIAIGWFLVLSVPVMPEPFSWYIGLFGTSMIAAGAILLLVVAIIYIVIWLRKPR
jgi:hypothetical protein